MPRQLKGVLFDLDGTLIDWSRVSLGWREIEASRLSRVHTYVLHRQQTAPFDADRLTELYLQRTRAAWDEASTSLRAPHMPNILMSVLDELGVDCDRLSREEVIRVYDWDAVPGTVVFPDVPPMIETLRAQGIKLGIVTNASQPMALRDVELATHGLLDYFPDCRLAAADTGYLKPHPRIFQAALDQMGSSADETLFVGDNPVADIAGAQGVGMRAVHRTTTRATFDDSSAQTEGSLCSFDELPAILDAWYPGWRDGIA